MEKKILETNDVMFEMADGIVYMTYKDGLKITLENAKRIVIDRKKFTEGKIYPGIIFMTGLTSINREAREYLASDEAIIGINACAVVSDSVFNKFLANFFLRISFVKPKMPAKLFTDKAKALKWLEKYKEPR